MSVVHENVGMASQPSGDLGDLFELQSTTSGGSPRRLLDAKRHRLRAEGDVQLLRNRIQRLLVEEERAKKKIDETRRRSKQIVDLKLRNAEKKRKEAEAKARQEAERKAAARQRALERADREASIRAKRVAVAKAKRREVLTAKQERRSNMAAMEQYRQVERSRVSNVREQIRSLREEQSYRKMRNRELVDLKSMGTYEERVDKEETLALDAERAVMDLEKQEAELIARLKIAQEVQRTAYSDLEQALEVRVD